MRRILVTGASRGIGRAIALELAAPGRVLLLHGRDEAALAATQRAVEERGAEGHAVVCDLADAVATVAMADAIAREPLDVLVNNAGIAIVRPLGEVSLGDWERSLAVNVTAPFLLTQRLAPVMPEGSSIVNILSIAAKTGFSGWSSYSASKFALEGFSQAVREELRARRIRVMNIYPAATDTEIWESLDGEWPREKMMEAAHIASAVAFALAQPASVAVENIALTNTVGAL